MSNAWHIKNWFRVGKNISWSLNIHTLLGFLYLYNPFRKSFFLSHANKKHEIVISFLENEFNNIIYDYKVIQETDIPISEDNYIWTLWWQGTDNAPPLVKACLKSMQVNANGAKLVILTKDNYKNYIDLPPYILEKREKGYISFAQLSDIFRFTLLEKYGGLWLDSTIFVSKPIPKEIFNYNFYSLHTKWEESCFVQHNLYHGFCIGSKPHAKLVSFTRDVFYKYWETKDTLIDYLMIDYIIMIAYKHFPDIKNQIDSLPYTSERLYDLVHMLNMSYNKIEFDNLKNECLFSKLDWHKKYKEKIKGKKTFYKAITEILEREF